MYRPVARFQRGEGHFDLSEDLDSVHIRVHAKGMSFYVCLGASWLLVVINFMGGIYYTCGSYVYAQAHSTHNSYWQYDCIELARSNHANECQRTPSNYQKLYLPKRQRLVIQ